MSSISNRDIINVFSKEENKDIQKTFVSVFPSNCINLFISFHSILKKKTQKAFFIINTDRFEKKGTHWWSFLNIHLRKEVMLFESLGFSGLNEFIIQDDKKIIKTLLYDF